MIIEYILFSLLAAVFFGDFLIKSLKRKRANYTDLIIEKKYESQKILFFNIKSILILFIGGAISGFGFVKLADFINYGESFSFNEILQIIYVWDNKGYLYNFIIGFFSFWILYITVNFYMNLIKNLLQKIKKSINAILLFLINQKKKVVVFLILIPTLKLFIHYLIYPIKKSVVIGREKVEQLVKGFGGSSYKNIYGESVRKGLDVHIEVLFKEELILFMPSILIALLGFWLFYNKK